MTKLRPQSRDAPLNARVQEVYMTPRVFQLTTDIKISDIKISPEEEKAARAKVRPRSRDEPITTRIKGVFMTLKG